MELRVLKYFMTVAREESMTRAAEKLFITQPTLSRQIAELEDEQGTPLFVRGNRNLALTAAGALLKRRVEEMLALEERIKQEIAQGDDVGGNVSIGLAVCPQGFLNSKSGRPSPTNCLKRLPTARQSSPTATKR